MISILLHQKILLGILKLLAIRSIVNDVHSCPGHNISCDLHMEHINKVVKVVIEGLGANKSEKSIKRVQRQLAYFLKLQNLLILRLV